jgi:hypothetical protein
LAFNLEGISNLLEVPIKLNENVTNENESTSGAKLNNLETTLESLEINDIANGFGKLE